MKWAYPLWNEILCIIIPVEIINTWLYVAWRNLAPHNDDPPITFRLVRIFKITLLQIRLPAMSGELYVCDVS